MPEADFVLAVDGGGSKTEAELRDRTGQRVARGRAGPCNLYRDPDHGLAALDEAWRQCCAAAGLKKAQAAARTVLSAALAGVGASAGRQRFHHATADFARSLLSSDGYAALVGAFDAGPGVLLSIGTGSVACRLDAAGGFTQVGGWGFPAGDRGSGAWIGLQLVGAWLEQRDGVGEADAGNAALWVSVQQRVGAERADILHWLRAAGPAEFASLAPLVLDAARQGSPRAVAILDEAAAHLAALVRRLRPMCALDVALSGGLAPALAPRLAARLGHGFASQPASPLQGAWLIGIGRMQPEFATPPQGGTA